MPHPGNIARGRWGEDRAAEWYAERGYRLIDRNWRCPTGEIDLVLRRRRQVVISEVKTRRTAAYGPPALAVGVAKQRRLRRLAMAWLDVHPELGWVDLRFDVVAITGASIEVYQDAF